MNSFIVWYVALPWHEALALCILFSAVVSAIVWGAVAYFDPLKVELRAIRGKRRRERRLIAQTRAMLLKRHDAAADRNCYRDHRQLTR